MEYLKETCPELFSEINIEKTLEEYPNLNIDTLPRCTSMKVWWKCKNGHDYFACVISRSRLHSSCPYCSGRKPILGETDLETWCHKNNREDILDEWDYDKNIKSPIDIKPTSKTKCWFKCPLGHSYLKNLSNKTIRGDGCPICNNKQILSGYNDLKTWCINNNRKDILEEWDYNKNLIKPEEIFPGTAKKIWFKCQNGHEYIQPLYNRTGPQKCGCPYCVHHKSAPELLFYNLCKEYLDKNSISGLKFGRFEVDIFIPSMNVCVEYDGKRYHDNSEYSLDKENRKNKLLLSKKYKVIRIKEEKSISKFKEDINDITVYYLSDKYNTKYFENCSKIFEDFSGKIVTVNKIKKIFSEVKILNY